MLPVYRKCQITVFFWWNNAKNNDEISFDDNSHALKKERASCSNLPARLKNQEKNFNFDNEINSETDMSPGSKAMVVSPLKPWSPLASVGVKKQSASSSNLPAQLKNQETKLTVKNSYVTRL